MCTKATIELVSRPCNKSSMEMMYLNHKSSYKHGYLYLFIKYNEVPFWMAESAERILLLNKLSKEKTWCGFF